MRCIATTLECNETPYLSKWEALEPTPQFKGCSEADMTIEAHVRGPASISPFSPRATRYRARWREAKSHGAWVEWPNPDLPRYGILSIFALTAASAGRSSARTARLDPGDSDASPILDTEAV